MKNYTLIFLKAFFIFCLSLPAQAQFLPCSFNAIPDSSQNGTVQFSMNPAAGPHITWDFGDNSTGTGSQVSHTYNGVGPFNVCVTEFDSAGRVLCTFCDLVYPFGNTPICNFSFSPDPHDSLGINFVALAGPHATVTWSFGDGTMGTGLTSNHHFATPGTYLVCMTVVDSTSGSGQACTTCQSVIISGGHSLLCSYAVSPTPGSNGTFIFSSHSLPGSLINWSFGDGTSGHGMTVTHAYPAAGVYQVCMDEVDSLGNVLCTFCDSVAINTNPGISCQFTYSHMTSSYLDVQFISQATVGGSLLWDFGDGATGVGATANHTYAADGIYNVCHTLLDSLGNTLCHTCKLVNIRNPLHPVCHANFQAVSLGLMGHFIDLSSVNPATAGYSWDFGDGNSSTLRFPQHQYSSPGTYTVCLNVTDSNCVDQFCSTLVVDTTINNPIFCNAYFVTLQMAPYQLTVVNMSSGINLNFNWDFGDGTTSNQHYPSHSYASTGTYILCLTVTGGGCTNTYCDTVSVDSTGRINRMSAAGFTINVVSPDQLTGITDIQADNFVSVYPNPVSDLLSVQVDTRSESGYRVLSINGSEIASGIFNSDKNILKTSSWKSGFYLLEITRNDGVRNFRKIIKE